MSAAAAVLRAAVLRSILCGAVFAVAGCATTPPDQDPVQIKLNDLDGRLQRIERVLANQSLLDLANELEVARSDVRSLHNDVDLLSNDLAAARKQNRDLYADLDRRVKALEVRSSAAVLAAPQGSSLSGASGSGAGGGGGGGTPAGGAATGSGDATGGIAYGSGAAAGAAGAGAATSGLTGVDGGDKASYQFAFGLLKDSRYDEAIAAFQQFLRNFPDSGLADNAQYWLGEAYYVQRNFTAALVAFQGVVDKYPQSRKLGDALLKIGYCDYELKQYDLAKQVLSDVVAKYADTPAGNLAKQRLDKLAAEGH
jgi:tol-pal system protein YbgF